MDHLTERQFTALDTNVETPAPVVPVSVGERLRAGWAAVRAALGSLLGLAPHVLHHVGILAGTAFLAGFWGNLGLYVAGLLLSIPLLKRLRTRFGSNVAPITGVAIFTVLFLFSALVLGPAINPAPAPPVAPTTSQGPQAGAGHDGHHPADGSVQTAR